jgi:hypothetical protein
VHCGAVQDLKIQHVIDVMHCEKNFCKNLLKPIFGDKEKDYFRNRQDLEEMNIRPELWLKPLH